jgi:hyperosmotically inducible periplasmic protein
MNAKKMLTAAVAAIGMIGAMVAQADEPNRTMGEYTDDKVLHTKVWAALTEDKTAEAREINLEVYKGVVQLNGFVDNEKEKARAEEIAKGVAGVKGVENNLALKGDKKTTGEAMDDSALTAKVKTALAEDSTTKAHEIKVATRQGVVQLSGFVDSAAQKDAAGKVAGAVSGVKSVQNNLSVRQ